MTGMTNNASTVAVTIPTIIGVAMRFITLGILTNPDDRKLGERFESG